MLKTRNAAEARGLALLVVVMPLIALLARTVPDEPVAWARILVVIGGWYVLVALAVVIARYQRRRH